MIFVHLGHSVPKRQFTEPQAIIHLFNHQCHSQQYLAKKIQINRHGLSGQFLRAKKGYFPVANLLSEIETLRLALAVMVENAQPVSFGMLRFFSWPGSVPIYTHWIFSAKQVSFHTHTPTGVLPVLIAYFFSGALSIPARQYNFQSDSVLDACPRKSPG